MGEVSLSTHRTLDAATLWASMRRLVERVSTALESATVLDDCLDVVLDLLGADRGLVLLTLDDGASSIVNARGSRGALDAMEREELSRTIVRQALESDTCVRWDVRNQPLSSASVSSLGIYAALAAPLRGGRGRGPRGVLYVDFRHPSKQVEEQHVEFFMAAVSLFGVVLEQNELAEATRDKLRGVESQCVESRHTPTLDSLLAPQSMAHIRGELESAVGGTSPILVLGESGTGKTLIAHAIAEASGRRPIVRAVLGGSDDLNTIASELFGHLRGAFSGAVGKRVGLVEYANGGTLILDEILNLQPQAQKLLLDFTQFGAYRPLGHDHPQPKHSEVRIIAATNGDIDAAIRDGRFREDLFYRLAAVTLRVPPLRARRSELPTLAESTLQRLDPSRTWTLSLDLRRLLVSNALDWPGNVRQFERVIQRARERALVRSPKSSELRPEHLGEMERSISPEASSQSPPASEEPASSWKRLQDAKLGIESEERRLIRESLERHGGVVAHAAKELGVARTTLAGRVDALGLARK